MSNRAPTGSQKIIHFATHGTFDPDTNGGWGLWSPDNGVWTVGVSNPTIEVIKDAHGKVALLIPLADKTSNGHLTASFSFARGAEGKRLHLKFLGVPDEVKANWVLQLKTEGKGIGANELREGSIIQIPNEKASFYFNKVSPVPTIQLRRDARILLHEDGWEEPLRRADEWVHEGPGPVKQIKVR